MSTKLSFFLRTFVALTVLVIPVVGYAQFGGKPISFSMIVEPSLPKPGERFTVSLQGVSTNLDAATIVWFENGVNKGGGVGVRRFESVAGEAGTASVIVVAVDPIDGEPFENQVTITPARINFLTQAFTYVPPLYKGKALSVSEGTTRVVAIPELGAANDSRFSRDNLIYRWFVDGNPQESSSGFGRFWIDVRNSLTRDKTTVRVMVATRDGSQMQEETLEIRNEKPFVAFYEASPLFGTVLGKELGSRFIMPAREFSIAAVPFFMSITGLNDPLLSLEWVANGSAVRNTVPINVLTLRQEGEGGGSAQVSVRARRLETIFQEAANSFVAQYQE
jgi:hypothetical protein